MGATVRNARWCWQIRKSSDKQIALPWLCCESWWGRFLYQNDQNDCGTWESWHRRKSVSPELAFSHQVSDPHSFLLCLTLSPFFPLSYFWHSSHHPPYLSQSLSHSPPCSPSMFPSPGREVELELGSGHCFSNCRSWHISGSRNQFSGSWNQFKGSWPDFFFNGTEENQIEQCPSNIVRVSTICETLYVPVYVCPG